VIRPADANETAVAWKVAVSRREAPTLLALSRQNMPVYDRSVYAPASGLEKGAYVMADFGSGVPQIILMASGSEVALVASAAEKLAAEGVAVRLVSFPSWELFAAQDVAYRESVLPPGVKTRLAVEAGVAQGWERWVGDQGAVIAMHTFGASAPYKPLFEHYGFTVEQVLQKAKSML
jgi:transketolase